MTTTSRLVDGLARALPARHSRRGFLTRTAVVGSALAAAPLDFVLKPGTAYAAVCNCKGSACQCGSACCDGYTEFCCTITGRNTCPPNTLLAGWWKADTSPQFCGGPRYYMDCNAPCGGCRCGSSGLCPGSCSGTGCGCANGNCGNRAAGCNLFRYGQCNQQIPCLGPIVCRIVTCVPPWAIEPTCNTVPRVDEFTAFHDRPCLHDVTGSLDLVQGMSDSTRFVGWALDYDTQAPVGIQAFVNGTSVGIFGANGARADVARAYPGYGVAHGFDFTIPHPGLSHQVCLVALNGGYPSTNQSLGCRTIPTRTTGSPFGALDSVSPGLGSVRVRGWVVDPDRPDATAVHVYVDGVLAGSAVADLPRPDIGAILPASGSAHGYDFTVPAPGGRHQVCVYGINIGPASPNPGIGCRDVDVPAGRPIGVVDKVQVGAGKIYVAGWALDPDTPNPIAIHVYAGNRLLGSAIADDSRPDVGATYPGFGSNHGFNAIFSIPAGTQQVVVYAINAGPAGPNPSIHARTVFVPSGSPVGVTDVVQARSGAVRVAGWAWDPDTDAPVTIHAYRDNALVASFVANLNRPDVGAAFPLEGPNHGFDVTITMPRGTHLLRLFAINAGAAAPNPAILATSVTT